MKFEVTSDRRRFFQVAVAAAALLGSLPRRAWAALPHLSVDKSATAKALNYVEDDTKAAAPHQPGQDCLACVHYQGKAGDAYGPCALFPGFDVNAKGWCSGFQAKK
ncbi:MAG TPA: high-potential iron-sulfur protein [Ottowia sp.]|nr:high-potential iron-sulfur protein [Ottowia sp.]